LLSRPAPSLLRNSAPAIEICRVQSALLATEAADYLVHQGIPFRQAHDIVGKVLREAEKQNISWTALPLDALKKISSAFEADLAESLTWRRACREKSSRRHGTGKRSRRDRRSGSPSQQKNQQNRSQVMNASQALKQQSSSLLLRRIGVLPGPGTSLADLPLMKHALSEASLPRGSASRHRLRPEETGALDLAILSSDVPASAAAVFTQNLVVAAPVLISKQNLPRQKAACAPWS